MSRGSSKQRKPPSKSHHDVSNPSPSMTSEPRRAVAGAPMALPDGIFIAGLVPLIAAVALTGVLVANHLGSLSLPGCRPGGACEQAAAGPWGKVPGTTWPVSFVGLAYFVGLLCAWLSSKSAGISPPLKNLVRLGMAVSVMYVIALISEGHACYYCIGTHVANLLFWLIVESLRPAPGAAWKPVVTTAVTFLLASAALGATEWRGKKAEEARQETQLADSTKEIIKSISNPQKQDDSDSTPVTAANDVAPSTDGTTPAAADDAPDRPWKGGFTGRYRLGPEKAAIRIVLFTDYQCPDCKRSENDILALMNARTDVSVSVKHFPFCTDCNPGVGKNLHPNACWAARAAETAGILRGSDGFWEMHKALFDRGGGFTNPEFDQMLQRFQYVKKDFVDVMQSAVTKQLIESDIREALWLGLHYTPMVFINGRELKGVFAHQAISRAVAEIVATNPPPATSENDQPPPAADKYVSDWREGEMKLPGEDINAWPMGVQQGARLHIVMWGDYQEPNTAKADEIIRRFIEGRTDAQYLFRHYPVNQACNKVSQLTKHPNACRMSQAAEAAGLLYGIDGYWKIHDWLMKNQNDYSDQALREAALTMGLMPDALLLKMDSPEVAAGVSFDCELGKRLGLNAVPCIYVNQRFVPRWFRAGDSVLERILQAALEEGSHTSG